MIKIYKFTFGIDVHAEGHTKEEATRDALEKLKVTRDILYDDDATGEYFVFRIPVCVEGETPEERLEQAIQKVLTCEPQLITVYPESLEEIEEEILKRRTVARENRQMVVTATQRLKKVRREVRNFEEEGSGGE